MVAHSTLATTALVSGLLLSQVPGALAGRDMRQRSNQSGGVMKVGGNCKNEGEWNCMTTSWQRCASGKWSEVIDTADGTVCAPVGRGYDFYVKVKGDNKKGGDKKGGNKKGGDDYEEDYNDFDGEGDDDYEDNDSGKDKGGKGDTGKGKGKGGKDDEDDYDDGSYKPYENPGDDGRYNPDKYDNGSDGGKGNGKGDGNGNGNGNGKGNDKGKGNGGDDGSYDEGAGDDDSYDDYGDDYSEDYSESSAPSSKTKTLKPTISTGVDDSFPTQSGDSLPTQSGDNFPTQSSGDLFTAIDGSGINILPLPTDQASFGSGDSSSATTEASRPRTTSVGADYNEIGLGYSRDSDPYFNGGRSTAGGNGDYGFYTRTNSGPDSEYSPGDERGYNQAGSQYNYGGNSAGAAHLPSILVTAAGLGLGALVALAI